MKKYILELDVPNDFNPDEMDVEISYPNDDSISVSNEGFIDSIYLLEDVRRAIDNMDYLDKLGEVKSTDVVIFRYSVEFMDSDPETVILIQKLLESKLGCTVIGLVGDVDVLVQNSAEAINMLKAMIDKINAKAIIKLA